MPAPEQEPATSPVLLDLNTAQREAVAWPSGNRLVLASAGSGKTRVLVHRMAWLHAERAVAPRSIMMVTFTNKAAKQMRQRAQDMPGGLGRSPEWVGTFHGLSLRMLRAHHAEAGLSADFQVIDSDDQRRIVKTLCKDSGIAGADLIQLARGAQAFINRHKERGQRADDARRTTQDASDERQAFFFDVYQRYEAHCRRVQAVDFGELLLRALELLRREGSKARARYHQQFEHILVDEFQDTNRVQYHWLQELAANGASVMAVGDDDQSIYGWRGAQVENVQRFTRDFPEVQVLRLEQNYRSTQAILDAANAVIRHNADRLGKTMWTERQSGEAVALFSAYNEREEAAFFVERVQERAAAGSPYREIAALYRTHAQSRALEEALLRASIPYQIYGGLRFYQRREVRDALAYLRLLANPDDSVAFERAVNTPSRGVGPVALERLRERARQNGQTPWQAALAAAGERAGGGLATFVALIESWRRLPSHTPLHELAERAIRDSGLMAMHASDHSESGVSRSENLEELLAACQQFSEMDSAPDDATESELERFLDQVALDAGERHDGQQGVQLMTLHSAKGLEFDHVYITGMEDRLFPHALSAGSAAQLEEERRLFYVGITRARRHLCLCWSRRRTLHGKRQDNARSPFLREVPASMLNELRRDGGGDVTRRLVVADGGRDGVHAGGDFAGDTSEEADMREREAIVHGQRVCHQRFGEGTVLGTEGRGHHLRVQVRFDAAGSKWLVASYANLSAL